MNSSANSGDKASKMPPAIVLGLGQNGLATVRSLGRKGVPVIGIDRDLNQYTARSKYCKRVYCSDFKKGDGAIEILRKIGSELPEKGVIFPSGDFGLFLASERREELEEFFHFAFPEREVVRLTLDKKRFYQFAAERGFVIPQTFFPADPDECARIAPEVNYPCIIKPFQPSLGWRQAFPDQKLFEADNASELMSTFDRLYQVHSDLVVQEKIEGDDDQLAFSLTYFDRSSRPLGLFTGHKVRQFPPRSGTSSLAESRWDPVIAQKTLEILSALKYTGYGSVEFKWDPRSREYKAIEVTARTWFPHGISMACGLNLEWIAYCDLIGRPVEPGNGFKNHVKWIHEERDLRSSLQYWNEGALTVGQWLDSYRGNRTYAIWARDDVMPGMKMLAHLATVPYRWAARQWQS